MKEFDPENESTRKSLESDSAPDPKRARADSPVAPFIPDGAAAVPANAVPIARIVERLQQTEGNSFVQRMVSQSRGGQPLDPSTRSEMERAFGEDFGDVRVHSGTEEGVRAATRDADLYFAAGEYRPSTEEGKQLLAHELAHVVQQRSTGPATPVPSNDLENEADRAAAAAVTGRRAVVAGKNGVPAVQFKKDAQEQPAMRVHGHEVSPSPANGTIDAAGKFTIAYNYDLAGKVVLTLHVPGGVAVSAVPLGEMGAGDFHVHDSGGTGARSVAITVSSHATAMARLQLTFTQGSFTYIVVFQFIMPAIHKAAPKDKK